MNEADMREVDVITYEVQIAKAIREAYDAYEEAINNIRNHEDGPLTMRAVLRDIRDRIAEIETEATCMSKSYQNLQMMLALVSEQRDAAIRQRNAAVRDMLDMQQAEQDREGYFYP